MLFLFLCAGNENRGKQVCPFRFNKIMSSFRPSIRIRPIHRFRFRCRTVATLQVRQIRVSVGKIASPMTQVLTRNVRTRMKVSTMKCKNVMACIPLNAPKNVPFNVSNTDGKKKNESKVINNVCPSTRFPVSIKAMVDSSYTDLRSKTRYEVNIVTTMRHRCSFQQRRRVNRALRIPFGSILLGICLLRIHPKRKLRVIKKERVRVCLFLLFILRALLKLTFVGTHALILF